MRRKDSRAAPERVGTARAIVRFGVGAVSLGADALVERVRHADGLDGQVAPPGDSEDGDDSISIGDVGAGIAVTATTAVGRALSGAELRRRRLLARLAPWGGAPLVGPLTYPIRGAFATGESALRGLSRRGRIEVIAGRRMVQRAVRDVAAQSFNQVAEVALEQVTHSPEVADLVKTQTAGVATETIVEMRENSKRADERVERRIRSWLGLGRSDLERTPRDSH